MLRWLDQVLDFPEKSRGGRDFTLCYALEEYVEVL